MEVTVRRCTKRSVTRQKQCAALALARQQGTYPVHVTYQRTLSLIHLLPRTAGLCEDCQTSVLHKRLSHYPLSQSHSENGVSALNDEQQSMLRENTWQQMVMEQIMKQTTTRGRDRILPLHATQTGTLIRYMNGIRPLDVYKRQVKP